MPRNIISPMQGGTEKKSMNAIWRKESILQEKRLETDDHGGTSLGEHLKKGDRIVLRENRIGGESKKRGFLENILSYGRGNVVKSWREREGEVICEST